MTLFPTRANRRQFVTGLGLTTLLTITSPGLISAQRSPFTPATPAPAATTGKESLSRLLAMVPLAVLDGATTGVAWSWNDIAGQFNALSMHHDLNGPAEDEPWANATNALDGASPNLAFGFDEELIAGVGFHPLGLDQNLYVGDPGTQVQLFAAPFDADALFATWTSSGYQQAETISGVTIWTIGPNAEFDVEHPVQRRVISSMNNLALVDDVIVATPTLGSLETVLQFIASGGESLLDDPATGALVLTLPGALASAMALHPAALAMAPVEDPEDFPQAEELEAIRTEVGPMPSAKGAIAAVEAGAYLIESDWSEAGEREETIRPDAGGAYLRLAAASSADASQMLTVFEQRWARLSTLPSPHLLYADIMELANGSTTHDIVELDFRQLLQPGTWRQMVLSRDLLPLMPDTE